MLWEGDMLKFPRRTFLHLDAGAAALPAVSRIAKAQAYPTRPIILYGSKSIPAQNLGELITWLKAHPDQASAGLKPLSFRLIAILFQKQTGTQLTIIPYRGAGTLREDFISGRIELLFGLPFALS